MEQESCKMDKDETGCQLPEGPILCSNNCGFFGSATTMNLCSQCYRDIVMKQVKVVEAATAMSATQSPPEPQPEAAILPIEGALSQSVEAESAKAASSSAQTTPTQQPNWCFTCKKRVGLTGFKCRCGNQFCSLHRYHDKHNCSFDYRSAARDAIAKANPIIKADKIDKI